MKGLVLKDLLFIKSNIKTLAIVIVAVFIFSFTVSDVNIISMIPFMIVMICISSFSYDEFNKWDSYAIGLPVTRSKIVQSKYIFTILVEIIAILIGILITYIIGLFNSSVAFNETVAYMIGVLFGISLFIAVMYPLMFKFGSQKGRIYIFVVVAAVVFLGFALKYILNILNINLGISNLIEVVNNNMIIFSLIGIVVLLVVSYLVSLRIYKRKEF